MFIYISGGTRSGKSRFAQEMALGLSKTPVYIATAKIWDDDFAERVARHKQDRGPEWTTFEVYQDLYTLPVREQVVVIDCITLWLTNFFMDTGSHIEDTLTLFKREILQLKKLPGTFIFISNELGMGLHADTELGRKFTDLQGWANQYLAAVSDEAYFMVSGISVRVK